MKILNSISGGKTSAYMAIHYPADYNVFSVVLTSDKRFTPKDSFLRYECEKRIPGFIGSRELDETLKFVLEIEQKIGKEIKWIHAQSTRSNISSEYPLPYTYEDLINDRKALPNSFSRFCTTELKIYPIFWYIYNNLMEDVNDLIGIQIGFRADENQRVFNTLNKCQKVKIPVSCNTYGKKRNNLKSVEYRYPLFPLYDDGILKEHILEYWSKNTNSAPSISNCDMCFNHTDGELVDMAINHIDRVFWGIQQEKKIGSTFSNGRTIKERLTNPRKQNSKKSCYCTD